MSIVPLRQEPAPVTLSAIIPVTGRFDDPDTVYSAYRDGLAATGHAFEVIYVLDHHFDALETRLRALQAQGEPITIVRLTQSFGEAVSLNVGFQRARGELIVVLPPYFQIEPSALPAMVAALDRVDLVAACRDREEDHWLARARNWCLQRLAYVSGSRLRDLGCLVRAMRRRVLEEVALHDEHHRFLPLLAQHAGFSVEEMTLPQARSDRRLRLHSPSIYLSRVLDLIAIAFLLRFMQKPFRFFGTVGFVMAALGIALGLLLVAQRTFYHMPLADRPALLLAVLLVTLGIQIGAVGLIAEIIIFTRAGKLETFQVDRVVEQEEHAPVREHAGVAPPAG
jgi:glycosyltransferase involved in cell wall biosynthesis